MNKPPFEPRSPLPKGLFLPEAPDHLYFITVRDLDCSKQRTNGPHGLEREWALGTLGPRTQSINAVLSRGKAEKSIYPPGLCFTALASQVVYTRIAEIQAVKRRLSRREK